MFILAYNLHWPLSEMREMPTRERRWYIKRLTEQIEYEKEQINKTKTKSSTGQFSGKSVGMIPRSPPTQE